MNSSFIPNKWLELFHYYFQLFDNRRWKVWNNETCFDADGIVAKQQPFTATTKNFCIIWKALADFWRKLSFCRMKYHTLLSSTCFSIRRWHSFVFPHQVSAQCNTSIEFRLPCNFHHKNKVSFHSLCASNCFIGIFATWKRYFKLLRLIAHKSNGCRNWSNEIAVNEFCAARRWQRWHGMSSLKSQLNYQKSFFEFNWNPFYEHIPKKSCSTHSIFNFVVIFCLSTCSIKLCFCMHYSHRIKWPLKPVSHHFHYNFITRWNVDIDFLMLWNLGQRFESQVKDDCSRLTCDWNGNFTEKVYHEQCTLIVCLNLGIVKRWMRNDD